MSRHVMILASAGSGKTYALTNRFIALLAAGEAPERIVALTFTRKAAGEFFDKILNRLGAAAADPTAAKRLAAEVGHRDLSQADFLKLLRRVIESMHRLRLGTLDSFFAQIVRSFPLELGLSGSFEVLQEHAALLERRRVLHGMFARPSGGLAPGQKAFIEDFKQATFGAEEKRLGDCLDDFISSYHQTYLDAPEASVWGNPDRIWPNGNDWLSETGPIEPAVREMRSWLERAAPADKQRGRWEAFLDSVVTWRPGATLPSSLGFVLTKALESWSALKTGNAELHFDKKAQTLDRPASAALARLITHVVNAELKRRLQTTRGIHAVIRAYEEVYDGSVRRSGKLTFSDIQRLLQPIGLASGEDHPDRLLIDYRLDGRIDHWLLDEFQDTSFGQWMILRNLIDEVVQDPSGRRSFFCVGDVKQAIYAWREGDARLFGEVFAQYSAVDPASISREYLVKSWRSAPALIEMVNTVFGNAAAFSGLFPGGAGEAWNNAWRDHASALDGLSGQAALLHADDEESRWSLALRILGEVDPMGRGLTCAFLVQRNATATSLAEYLRQNGAVPAVAESDLHVCVDNPLGAALLALVKAAAFPGDRMAWEHVRMTPLNEILRSQKLNEPSELSNRILAGIHADGFERTLEAWIERLEPSLSPDDLFSRERGRQFAAAAGLFDATGSKDPAEFIDFMERHVVRPPDGDASVRVMTIHKAKGLEFDVVFLPDLEGQTLLQRREGLAAKKSPDRSTEWILELPSKDFRNQDPVLSAKDNEDEAEACYESLSLLYVAMTRAKRGLYIITKAPGNTKSANFPKLLGETLGTESRPFRVGSLDLASVWTSGDPAWFESIRAVAAANVRSEDSARLDPSGPMPQPRRLARRPSAERSGEMGAALLFNLEGDERRDFGTAVHDLLASVEWFDPCEPVPPWDLGQMASAEALACLEAEALAEIWRRPAKTAEVWRERSFEAIIDGAWVTGAFDRVVVVRDLAGEVSAVKVYDFKTDRIASAIELPAMASRHAPQMELYRKAAQLLTGAAPSAVETEIVSTRLRLKIRVPLASGS